MLLAQQQRKGGHANPARKKSDQVPMAGWPPVVDRFVLANAFDENVLRVAQHCFTSTNRRLSLYRSAMTFETGALSVAGTLPVLSKVLWERNPLGQVVA